MNRFLEALGAARLDGTYLKWLNMMAKTPLLILDDFGLKPLDSDKGKAGTLVAIMEGTKSENICLFAIGD